MVGQDVSQMRESLRGSILAAKEATRQSCNDWEELLAQMVAAKLTNISYLEFAILQRESFMADLSVMLMVLDACPLIVPEWLGIKLMAYCATVGRFKDEVEAFMTTEMKAKLDEYNRVETERRAAERAARKSPKPLTLWQIFFGR